MTLNAKLFKTSKTGAPPIPRTFDKLPGEDKPASIGKELPLLKPEEAQAQSEASAAKRAESGKTVVVGKPSWYNAVNRPEITEMDKAREAQKEAERKERLEALNRAPSRRGPSREALAKLGPAKLSKVVYGVHPVEELTKEGPVRGNKYSEVRNLPTITDKPAVNEEIRAQTGLEIPVPRRIDWREAAKQIAGKTASEDTVYKPKGRKSAYSRKQMDKAARELAFTHWVKTQPAPDLTEYKKALARHNKAHDSWVQKNPVPADEKGRKEWSENYATWKSENPAPSSERADTAREYQQTLFKQHTAFKNPRMYLKTTLGLRNIKQVEAHIIDHINKVNEPVKEEAQPKAEPKEKPKFTMEGVKPISEERSAAVEAFVKNPLSYHFGTGSGEGKK